jgi:hypothetical protein
MNVLVGQPRTSDHISLGGGRLGARRRWGSQQRGDGQRIVLGGWGPLTVGKKTRSRWVGWVEDIFRSCNDVSLGGGR